MKTKITIERRIHVLNGRIGYQINLCDKLYYHIRSILSGKRNAGIEDAREDIRYGCSEVHPNFLKEDSFMPFESKHRFINELPEKIKYKLQRLSDCKSITFMVELKHLNLLYPNFDITRNY